MLIPFLITETKYISQLTQSSLNMCQFVRQFLWSTNYAKSFYFK